jgi:3-phenylpropionate/trans-cinnamate dioxygenase ferredoxin component
VTRHRIVSASALNPGELMRVDLPSGAICLGHTQEGDFLALDDLCPHEQASLSEGQLIGRSVECPDHFSRFDMATGAVCRLPATEQARPYPVYVEGNDVYVEIPD